MVQRSMKVSGKKESNLEKDFIIIIMGHIMMATGKVAKSTVRVK